MTAYTSTDIRNIGLFGHSGCGKTELAESLLLTSGEISSRGSVARGTTVCDFDPQEKQLGHSLDASLCHFRHDDTRINLIDTPGYPDLVARALGILPAVETAAVVINAQMGVEPLTHQIMQAASEGGQCRMIIVNRIDCVDTGIAAILDEIRAEFGEECLPLNLPADGGGRVIDCYFQNDSDAETDFSSVSRAHTEIIDQVIEVDEALMELYLDQGEELAPAQLHDAFEKALREGHLIPVCFVSARSGAGIDLLLSIFSRLMPNPLESNPPHFLRDQAGKTESVPVQADPHKHVIAHVFKVSVDPFVGRIGVFRIYQGTVRTHSALFIGDGRKPFKPAHLFRLQGKKQIEIHDAIPGEICAVSKVDEIQLDAVLHDSHDEDLIYLQTPAATPPMVGLAIEPVRRGDEQKLSDALQKLCAEDPGIEIEHNATANETVIHAMGELHLRVLLDRMKSCYHVEVQTHPPAVAYRETVRSTAEGHHRHKKQTGGAGQFGEVYLKIRPLPRDSGYHFINKVVGGAIPSQFIPAVEKGVRQVIDSGVIAGFPMQDIEVTVCDGKFHSVDSKEVAFVAAGKKAFMDAVKKAEPVLLEPIVDIHIDSPAGAVGDITGDISGKRGRICGTTATHAGHVSIDGQIPLSELDNYQSALKSMTGGEGSFTLNFSHYDTVPGNRQKQLTVAHRQAGAE